MRSQQFRYDCLILMFSILSFTSALAQTGLKRDNLFDFNWRFHKGGTLGAEEPYFNDSDWRVVNLPHDWSIEDLPESNIPWAKTCKY
jgi:beta-galactosidase